MAINAATRPPGRSLKTLRMIWRFVSRYRLQLLGAAAALLVAAAATSGVPYAFKLIIDKGFAQGGGSTRDIARWFEYLLMLVGIMALATAVRYYFVSWLGERTVADIRLAVHRNLLRLAPGFFEENRPAEITSRITVDTTIIEQVVGTTVSVALRNIVLSVACIVILVWLSPKLAGMILLGLPFVLGPIVLPEYRDPDAGRLDLPSVALSLVTTLSVIFGLKQIAQDGIGPLPVAAG